MMKLGAGNTSPRFRIYLVTDWASTSDFPSFLLVAFFFSWLALTSQIWWFKVELGIASWIPLATLPSVWSPQVTSWGSAELPPIRASLSAEKCDSAEPTHQPVGTFSNEPLNGKCTDNSGIKWAPLIDFPNQYGTGAPSLCHLLPLPGGILRPSIILIRHYTWHKCWVD